MLSVFVTCICACAKLLMPWPATIASSASCSATILHIVFLQTPSHVFAHVIYFLSQCQLPQPAGLCPKCTPSRVLVAVSPQSHCHQLPSLAVLQLSRAPKCAALHAPMTANHLCNSNSSAECSHAAANKSISRQLQGLLKLSLNSRQLCSLQHSNSPSLQAVIRCKTCLHQVL